MGKLDTSSNELLKDSKISHAATVFFESKLDVSPNEDGNITVMDTKFSKDDFQTCRDLIQSMRSDVKTKSFLDYDDYAKLSLMNNIVTTYTKTHLNEEQTKVLISAVNDYINSQQDLSTENGSKETISFFRY